MRTTIAKKIENIYEYVRICIHSNDKMVNDKAVTGNRYTEYEGERYNERNILCSVCITCHIW